MEEFDKKDGFRAPEGYFGDFTSKLMDKLSEEGPAFPKKEGFTVPEGYFDGLHNNIRGSLDARETKVVRLNRYRKYYFAAAAVAAVVLLFFGINGQGTQEPTFEDLANSDIDAYFERYELGLSTYEIAEVIPVDELEINDIVDHGLEEEHIMIYLEDNIEDFEELNLEIDE